MEYVSKIIRTTFEWAVFLAIVGGLGDATGFFYKKAHEARTHGLVSLVQLNQSLSK